MAKARLLVWVLAVYTVIMGGLVTIVSPVMAGVFYGALIIQALVHTIWLCPRCVNMACPINPHSAQFMFGNRDGIPAPEAKPMNTTLPVFLLAATLAFGLVGVWMFSQLLWMFMAVTGGLMIYGYSRISCRICGNNCVFAGGKT